MAGQMQPEEELRRASWEQQKGETEHPGDDLLLAYVRRQHLDNWIEIHKHIQSCPDCRQQCLQYNQVSIQITSYMQAQATRHYPSIADSVMARIEQDSRQTWGKRLGRALLARKDSTSGTAETERVPEEMSPVIGSQFKQPGTYTNKRTSAHIPAILSGKRVARAGLPLWAASHAMTILVLIALLSVAVAALAAPYIHMNIFQHSNGPASKPFQVQKQTVSPVATTGVSLEATTQPVHTPTPKAKRKATSTAKVTMTPTATPGSGSGSPAIRLCSKPADISQWVVRICGSGFKPNDRILLYIPTFNSGYGSHWVQQIASAQGTVQYAFTINSNCKYVPSEILALDMTHFGKVVVLQDISFGTCPVPSPAASNHTW